MLRDLFRRPAPTILDERLGVRADDVPMPHLEPTDLPRLAPEALDVDLDAVRAIAHVDREVRAERLRPDLEAARRRVRHRVEARARIARASLVSDLLEDGRALEQGRAARKRPANIGRRIALDTAAVYLEDADHGARRAMLVLAGFSGITSEDLVNAVEEARR